MIVSSGHDMHSELMNSQKYGGLKAICIMTIPLDMPTLRREFHKASCLTEKL